MTEPAVVGPTSTERRLPCVLIYAPHEGEREEFPFDLFTLNSVEAEDLEDLGPWDSYAEFGRRLLTGNRRAIRAVLWVMRKRTEPDLEFYEVSVLVDELSLEFPDDPDDPQPAEPEGKDEPDAAATSST